MSEQEETKEVHTTFAIMASAVKKDFIPTEAELKTINSFMMCRWISNHPVGIEIANFLNNATEIPIDVQYWFVRNTMHNVRYITYPKKTSAADKDIETLTKYYDCNYAVAKQYYKILPKEELEKILNKYKHIGRTKI